MLKCGYPVVVTVIYISVIVNLIFAKAAWGQFCLFVVCL